eukprot:s890_g8.t1
MAMISPHPCLRGAVAGSSASGVNLKPDTTLHAVHDRLTVLLVRADAQHFVLRQLEGRIAVFQHGEANVSWCVSARSTCWKQCLDFSGRSESEAT